MLGQILSSLELFLGEWGGTLSFKIEPFSLGSLHSFFFFLSDGPIKLAPCTKQKKVVILNYYFFVLLVLLSYNIKIFPWNASPKKHIPTN
jgi:hypothetical protein